MRIISVSVKNFGSYKDATFNFDAKGLCLIQGATGSGKSTLCDVIPWVLFGKTAKGGAVDEVKSWGSKDTFGTITMSLDNKMFQVRRARSPNDLILWKDGSSVRGKDLTDTQKIINQLLGMDYETYLAGAYYHEFSKTAAFFTTTAKERRAICEQIVDLSLAKNIQLKTSEEIKRVKDLLNISQKESDLLESKLGYLIDTKENLLNNQVEEKKILIQTKKQLEHRRDNFKLEIQKTISFLESKLAVSQIEHSEAEIQDDTKSLKHVQNKVDFLFAKTLEKCSTCGGPADHKAQSELKDSQYLLQNKKSAILLNKQKSQKSLLDINYYEQQIEKIKTSENTYQTQIDNLRTNESTKSLIKDTEGKIRDTTEKHNITTNTLNSIRVKLADLELLAEVTNTLRSRTIINTISQVEGYTNKLLSEHFDAEIRVSFEVVDADKLEVLIAKDGNECSYTQLSKGQRQLLKLSFGLSIMKLVAQNNAVNFNCIFLDEALDGFDDNLKTKSYGLLQTLALEYSSVFVVEHNESLKSMFPNRILVTNTNGESTIEES